jgi:lipocalin
LKFIFITLRNTGVFKQIIGSAQILDPNVPAKLWLTFTFGPVKVSSDYWVTSPFNIEY